MKELLKSVHICQSYSKNKSGPVFFDSQCSYHERHRGELFLKHSVEFRGVHGNWISCGNGIPIKHISMGMGMGMISVGLGMTKNIWLKNSHLLCYSCIIIFSMRWK